MTTTLTHTLHYSPAHRLTITPTADWDSSPYTAAEEAATAAANQANLVNRRINAAQAVLDAFWKQPGNRSAIAAALRAAAKELDWADDAAEELRSIAALLEQHP